MPGSRPDDSSTDASRCASSQAVRFLPLLLISLATADPLPREIVPAKAVLVAQADEDGRKVWHTRFFRIDSDVALRPNDLLRLAQVADTTAAAVKAHPLPLFAPPEGKRPRIAIHASAAAYKAEGGVHGTAGMYLARQGLVLIQGEYLLRSPDAARSRLAPQNDEDLVVHELVHLCMHRTNAGLPQWLIEGLAEYFACAHTGAGRFSFGNMDQVVREHLRIRLSPDDPGIPLVPVAALLPLDGRGWFRYLESLPVDERYRAYATALLLAHQQLHGGKERTAALHQALSSPRSTRRPIVLLTPEMASTTQASMIRYWKPKGLTLEFTPDP
jgi:hypothetical protein